MHKRWNQLKDFVRRWWHAKPAVKASTAFVASEGLFESVFIVAAAVTYFIVGNWWLFILFSIWAFWEIFARFVIIRHVVL